MSSTPLDKHQRCAWAGTDPLMCRYHDEQWGAPEHDSRAIWEALMLDGFQAGLSWSIILRKREGFRKAFKNFNPEQVARFDETDVVRLLGDANIIRSRAKIEATIQGARIYPRPDECRRGFLRFRLEDGWRQADSELRSGPPQALHCPKRSRRSFEGAGSNLLGGNYLCMDAGHRDRE